jgi:hypothetical protein
MRQRIIIAFSVILLLLAVFLIARDLFRKSPLPSVVSSPGDDLTTLKRFDTTLTGYVRIRVIETGLINLSGIAVNYDSSIVLCGNGTVILLDKIGRQQESIRIGSVASCIAAAGNDLLIGTGSGISHYDIKARSLTRWNYSYADGYFTSIALNGNKVYAADASRKLIIIFDLSGNFIQEIGKKNTTTEAPGFILPSLYFDIAFGGFNDLWVGNTGRLRVEHYTENGYFEYAWGNASYEPNGFSGCCNPAHIAILPDGCFVTYEKGIDHIKLFDQTGKFLCYVGGAGSFRGNADFNLGKNNLVKDIAAGPDSNIYILDAYNRINVFQKKKS